MKNEKLSTVCFAIAAILSFFNAFTSGNLFFLLAGIYFAAGAVFSILKLLKSR